MLDWDQERKNSNVFRNPKGRGKTKDQRRRRRDKREDYSKVEHKRRKVESAGEKKTGCSLSMLKTGHRNLGKEKTSDRMIQRNENLIQSGANRYLHCVKMMFLCVFFFF